MRPARSMLTGGWQHARRRLFRRSCWLRGRFRLAPAFGGIPVKALVRADYNPRASSTFECPSS